MGWDGHGMRMHAWVRQAGSLVGELSQLTIHRMPVPAAWFLPPSPLPGAPGSFSDAQPWPFSSPMRRRQAGPNLRRRSCCCSSAAALMSLADCFERQQVSASMRR